MRFDMRRLQALRIKTYERKSDCSSGEFFNQGRHLVTAEHISWKASFMHVRAEKLYYLWKDRIEARFL